ncbi:MAG: hypothetical protein KAU31_04825 [Spirochaetaceae bacterium]|nr:hypothetical protein [Spirochaetaceae bacterium]
MSSTSNPIVFISCGQRTNNEKNLGQAIEAAVANLPDIKPYFAQTVSSLDGLTNSIFRALDRAIGFICVLHNRGQVDVPGHPIRASVWVEQEIAIAAFIRHVLGRDIRVLLLAEKGVAVEGVREHLLMNPVQFSDNDEALELARREIAGWDDLSALNRGPLSITMDWKMKQHRSDHHDYRFMLYVQNTGDQNEGEFHVDLWFPRRVVPNARAAGAQRIEDRDTESQLCIRGPAERRGLYPGDKCKVFDFGYFMNDETYRDKSVMDSTIKAVLYQSTGGPLTDERPFVDFQQF